MALRAAILAVALAFGVQVAEAPAATTGNPCTGADLHGTFTFMPGSQGAGNLTYVLRLRNASAKTCVLAVLPDKHLPALRLLNAKGAKLPTNAAPSRPKEPVLAISLAPGKSAVATARFSPDVPGKGEQQIGRCEPVASKLRVSPSAGGSLVASIAPPTSVCEHGGMTILFSAKPQ
jgi:uncharacterized protein DUF4232